MPANIFQAADGGTSFTSDGAANSGNTYGFIPVSTEYVAASIDKRFFTANRPMIVRAVRLTVTVAGTDGGAVSAVIRKVPSGTAITSGVLVQANSFNLKGTADTVQTDTLSATLADLRLVPGDSLAIDFTGTLTSATGVATVDLALL